MEKTHVINDNREFQRVYRRGTCYPGSTLVTYVLKNRSKGYRVGITTSKKIGCAVRRNRARRVIRAALRPLAPQLSGVQIVFVARSKTTFVKSDIVLREMTDHLTKAGILNH